MSTDSKRLQPLNASTNLLRASTLTVTQHQLGEDTNLQLLQAPTCRQRHKVSPSTSLPPLFARIILNQLITITQIYQCLPYQLCSGILLCLLILSLCMLYDLLLITFFLCFIYSTPLSFFLISHPLRSAPSHLLPIRTCRVSYFIATMHLCSPLAHIYSQLRVLPLPGSSNSHQETVTTLCNF